tara:strand:- start:21 stop:650 length:630 start_codon:yes stop_codon:yes gene_type:complete
MDPAELDRWTVFDVEPTTEDWLTWAKDNTETVVWDFINQNRSHLEHAEDFEPNKVYPSRRSWKRLNDCLEAAGMLGEEHNPAIFHLATGFVGFEASVSFNDFVKNYERQVTIEMILDEGQVDKTSSFNINEHCALIEKMEASTAFEGELTEDQCKNLANYFVSLPSEAVMKLWQALGSGNVDNVTRFHKAQADNGETVGSKLVTILTGK